MTVQEINEIVLPHIDEPIINFEIKKQIFFENNCRKTFNNIIRNNVANKFGAYVWVDKDTNEIVYIGMAGRIKANGTIGKHTIQNRLLASRGKNKLTKKDIQTNEYVQDFMINDNIETLKFYIIYSKNAIPPAFIEAILLYEFYKKNNRLPKLNNSF